MDTKGTAPEAKTGAGYVYVLTNPSFPTFVKIGYADDVQERVKDLNRSSGLPFAFRIYCTLEVPERLADKAVHAVIDRLAPGLRSVEEFEGRTRVREFYRMPAEQAYGVLEGLAAFSGLSERLKRHAQDSASAPVSQPTSMPSVPVSVPEPEPEPVPAPQPEPGPADSPRTAALYASLKDRVLALGGVSADDSQYPRAAFLADGQEFMSAIVLKTRIKLVVRGVVPDEADAPEDGRGGHEDTLLRIDSADDLDRFMPLIERAFRAAGQEADPEEDAARAGERAEAFRRRAKDAREALDAFILRHGSALRGKDVMLVRAGLDWPDLSTEIAARFENLGLKGLTIAAPALDGVP